MLGILVTKTIYFTRVLNTRRSKGQALIEYVFLIAVVFILSVVLLKGVGGQLGELWKFVVGKVAYPTPIDFN